MVHIEVDQFWNLFCCKTDDDGKTTQNESDKNQPEDRGKTDIDFGPEDLGVASFKEVRKSFKKPLDLQYLSENILKKHWFYSIGPKKY